MTTVVQLEAFESLLRGRRIRWFLAPGSPALYPPGFQDQLFLENPPFQRRILLTCPSSTEAWKLTDRWDTIFQPATAMDWSLILTFLLHQPQPCLVVCTPTVKVPPILFQKLLPLGLKAPTIVCFQTLALPFVQAPVLFDATFFPPAKAVEHTLMEAMQAALANLISADKLGSFNIRDALKDLRGAGATLAVSSIEEPEPTLYWYYASETNSEGQSLVASVLQTLMSRGS